MAYTICHRSLEQANHAVAVWAAASPFKLSRFKEVHAQALGFKSYNALVAMLKSRPLIFTPQSYIDSIETIVKSKFGYDHTKHLDDWNCFVDNVYSCSSVHDHLTTARFVRLDFQVLHIPSNGFQFPSIINLSQCFDKAAFCNINDFLSEVIGNSSHPQVCWEKTPRSIQDNTTWYDAGFYDHDSERESGVSLADPNYANHDAVLYFTTTTGVVESTEYRFSKTLSTGYGSLFIKINKDAEIALNSKHRELLVGLSSDQNIENRLLSPVVSFLGEPKYYDVDLLPSEMDGHFCHEINMEMLTEYEPLSYMPGLTTKEAINNYLDSVIHIGNYIVPINENVEVDFGLDFKWHDGLHIEDQENGILINRPSGAQVLNVFGWPMVEKIDSIYTMLENAYMSSERYKDCVIQNTSAHRLSCSDTIHLTARTYVEILNIDFTAQNIKAICSEDFVQDINQLLSTIDSIDDFAALLKSIKTCFLLYNEQVDFKGKAYSSVWCAYDENGKEMVVFEMRSFESSLEQLAESLRVLLGLSKKCVSIQRSLEPNVQVKSYHGDSDWCGKYYSIIKPLAPDLKSM
ncbi:MULTISPECIES: hypothetical protein [Vibrio]|uniref:hypothetical protein n=1 Tax=Vibrio TaxID=662 RepID=UPI00078EDEC5|nr:MULTISPECIES: hypothetical protein [Vibrio]BAU70778.1 hypothetical protein [Vibrio sp. 04Ya108]BBM67654.1 hypothetical protein VA249_43000 [Vibrio alfacsensis]BCN27136.1 hypothetical protein VYA_43280 [Vibrio alfacsensis]